MASTEVEFSQPKKTGFQAKLQSTGKFIYNSEQGTCLGRGCISWLKIGAFYTVFYSCLAGFFGICMAVFFVTIDYNYPKYSGMDSMLKGNPGMGFRPMPDYRTTLVRFEQGKPSSYKPFTDHIQAFLDQYENENQVGENYIDCSNGRPPNSRNKVCRFNVESLGSECTWQKDFGYDEGQPCVLLKLNKVYNWEPDTGYTNASQPPLLGERFDKNYVGVTCEGENPADRENIGHVTFYPKGFGTWYYPFLNQEGYRQPIIMARFNNATNGVVIQIWCKAWAQNLEHHRNDKAASIHFELLVD